MKHYEKKSDSELLIMCAAKDESAFEELYGRFSRLIYSIAYGVLKNESDAEDAAADALVRIWTSAAAYAGGSAQSFICTIAKNTAIDTYRRRTVRETVPIYSENEDGSDELLPLTDGGSLEDEIIAKDEIARVMCAITELDEDHRRVVMMHDIDGVAYRDIAAALGISEGTVKSRLFRGHEKIRKMFSDGNKTH